MNTVIRDPQDLSDWFDLSRYDQWQHLSPELAMSSVRQHLDVLAAMGEYVEHFNRDVEVLESFEHTLITLGTDPYLQISDLAHDMFRTVSPPKCVELGIPVADELPMENEVTAELMSLCAELGPRLASPQHRVNRLRGVYNVTLADAMRWVEQAQEDIMEDVKQTAQRLADEHGWKYELVFEILCGHIPIGDNLGSSYIALFRHGSIPVILNQVERYLEDNGFCSHENGRPSEIKKLFQYQVLAYQDLLFWADLHGVSITRKCLSRALFPEGPYTDNDLSPSKTVGTFINSCSNRDKISGLVNLASTCTHWDDL